MIAQLILSAAYDENPTTAVRAVARALQMPITPTWPERSPIGERRWRRGTKAQRCLMLAEWIGEVFVDAADEADAMETRMMPFRPIGGEQYADQND